MGAFNKHFICLLVCKLILLFIFVRFLAKTSDPFKDQLLKICDLHWKNIFISLKGIDDNVQPFNLFKVIFCFI